MTITKPIILGTLKGPSFAWSELRALHDRVNAAEPTDQAQASITCQISGDTLTATIVRPLTPAEEVLHLQAEREADRAKLAEMLTNQFGRGLAPDRADELRRLLGIAPGHEQGTQAPAAPPATPNDNRPTPPESAQARADRIRSLVINSGFRLPDNAGELRALAKLPQNDATEAEVEEALGWPVGSITTVLEG